MAKALPLLALLLTGCVLKCDPPVTPPSTPLPSEAWVGWEQYIDAQRTSTWRVGGGFPSYEVCQDWAGRMEKWAADETADHRNVPGTRWIFLCTPRSLDPRSR